jgi:hypothetical protein
MPKPDLPATLNPSIVGQAEKAHNAVLKKVLSGTGLDEHQWITVQLAIGAGGSVARSDLVSRVAAAAKFDPESVHTAIAGLTGAGLLREGTGDRDELTVTADGLELVTALRGRVAELIGPAYSSVPPDDLATAARVLTTITQRLSKDLAPS